MYLSGHLQLVLAEREHASQSDTRIHDIVLASRDHDQLIALLQDGTVVGGNVQEERNDEFPISSIATRITSHPDLLCPSEDGVGDFIMYDGAQMRLIDDCQDAVGSHQGHGGETSVLDHKDLILRIANDGGLILRNLNDD